MSDQIVLQRIQDIFRDFFDDESLMLTVEMDASHIEAWDSLAHVILISLIEKDFKIKFSLSEIAEMKNVSDLVSVVQSKL